MIDTSERHFCLQMRTAPPRAIRPTQSAQTVHFARSTCAPRHDPPKVRRGFTSHAQNARATPQRERFDPPKVRRGFALPSQNVHRATARAIRPRGFASRSQNVHRAARAISLSQSDAPATKSTPRRQLPRNSTKTLESAAPVTQIKLATNPKSSKLLALP